MARVPLEFVNEKTRDILEKHEEDLKLLAEEDLKELFDLVVKQKEDNIKEIDAFLEKKDYGALDDDDFLLMKEDNLAVLEGQAKKQKKRKKIARDLVDKVAIPTLKAIAASIV